MLNVGKTASRTCKGVTRRELLQVGGLGLLGLSLADGLKADQSRATASRRRGDPSCIFIFLEGGPSQLEMFDPKPLAPNDIRGPYGAISTSVSGTQICELLPAMAQRMDRCAVIRSLTGFDGAHNARGALTGSLQGSTTYGAVVSRLKGDRGPMPPYIHLGGKLFNSPGVGGGVFGAACEPIMITSPLASQQQLPDLSLTADVPASRFQSRRALLGSIDRMRAQADADPALARMDNFHQRAANILTSSQVRDAFDLGRETDNQRRRYGANMFGQSLLMARRLVEAGTRFVQVKWYDWDGAWDIHGFNSTGIERMEEELCPRFDQGLAALLDDLHERGMFESTLVVVMGEMGRTPKINHWGGRDHWGPCLFALLAGAGIPGGTIVGSSDAHAAYPATFPVYPLELAATIYRRLGIDTNTDMRVRPFIGSAGPVPALV